MEYAIELLNITKSFPGIKANDNITVQVKKGEIHALLGENGAGKSTLMSVLFGLYSPDSGDVVINGKQVKISNPKIANKYGIGMVHQHFQLVDRFSALENITLGVDKTSKLNSLDYKDARTKIEEIMNKYDLNVDLDTKVEDMSVGMQQRVEILKVLYRENDIIILDEPTAVLTPQQIERLLDIIRALANDGKTIIFITHKLKEIKAVANRCSVLRKGKCTGTIEVEETDVNTMAEMMVGRNVSFSAKREKIEKGEKVLEVKNLKITKDSNPISFDVHQKEIVSIAGIEGNGQTTLVEILTGLKDCTHGEILFLDQNIEKSSIKDRANLGMAHIPEDRQKFGLIKNDTVYISSIIHQFDSPPFSKSGILNYNKILEYTNEMIEKYDVRSNKGAQSRVGDMSGGNQQKLIVGREIERSPKLLVAVQPTRGVDVGAIESIHKILIDYRNAGGAVLLVSLELDEVLDISDRILVMCKNEIVANKFVESTDENELGLFMMGNDGGVVNGFYKETV